MENAKEKKWYLVYTKPRQEQVASLAEQMTTLSGKEPGRDIEISFTGLRPGEKMYEELFHEKESMQNTGHPKITKAESRTVSSEEIEEIFADLQQACDDNDDAEILRNLIELVPEKSGGQDGVREKSKVVPIRRG